MLTNKLLAGYAETSTIRNPKEPEIVVVGEKEINSTTCQGAYLHPDGSGGWLRFKVKGQRRYYFQRQPY